ncbi:hypothetical protein [Microbacterium sp. P04]|uniref:hypothetical protein n=1 Tax=Microbacterium sp. P04 TaxID=3366947 RepID=UPI0037467B06
MKTRLIVAVALAGLIGLMSGCVGEPTPTETTPTFSSEEEAYAAAEETYRAYVDALNQVDLSDPETFEPVFALTTGDANANARKTFSEMHANGWIVGGDSVATVVEHAGVESGAPALAVCLDVSSVTVTDQSGASVVAADRGDVQSMKILTSISSSSPTGLALDAIDAREGEPLCDG